MNTLMGSLQPVSGGDGYPEHWPKVISDVKRIKVSDSTYARLSAEFLKSIGAHVTIRDIEEICNLEMFEKYKVKKSSMKKKLGEKSVNEQFLYHGTDPATVPAICAQNFDWRLCGVHGTAYGQGSYFALNASYSDSYARKKTTSTRYMFVASVLVGRSTQGSSSLKRPPPIVAGQHELYDSCVDNIAKPTIFVIFERDQCYPRYLISYC